MKLPSYKTILFTFSFIFLISIGILSYIIINNKQKPASQPALLNTEQNRQIISHEHVDIDLNKVTEDQAKSYLKEAGNITVNIYSYDATSIKFPINQPTPDGNYQYDITFTPDGINIIYAADQ